MKNKKIMLGFLLVIALLVLGACSNDNKDTGTKENDTKTEKESSSQKDMDSNSHDEMEHSSSGEVPDNLKEATNPKYEVGSKAKIETDHMKGMKGAEAKIVGAYNTRAYVISYTPTNGGDRVENHKWVIQEEIKNSGDKTLEPGTEVTVEADHMKGMKGAKATIESSEETTVYMIDYDPTTGGDRMKNHKWVTEDELSGK